MLNNIENIVITNQDDFILEQGFSQLPAEGKVLLRDYLKNLIGMQNSMAGACQDEVKERCSDKE